LSKLNTEMPKYTLLQGILGKSGEILTEIKARPGYIESVQKSIAVDMKSHQEKCDNAMMMVKKNIETHGEALDVLCGNDPFAVSVMKKYVADSVDVAFGTEFVEGLETLKVKQANNEAAVLKASKEKVSEELRTGVDNSIVNLGNAVFYTPRVVGHAIVVAAGAGVTLVRKDAEAIGATREKMREVPQLVYPEAKF